MPPFTPTDVYDRFLFNTREQVIGEPVDVFVDSLSRLSQDCKYEGASQHHLDLLIRDRFIIGIRDRDVQFKLLQFKSNELSLEKAVMLAKQQEADTKTRHNKRVGIKTKVLEQPVEDGKEAFVEIKSEDESSVQVDKVAFKAKGCENADFEEIDRDDLLQVAMEEGDDEYYSDFKDFAVNENENLQRFDENDDEDDYLEEAKSLTGKQNLTSKKNSSTVDDKVSREDTFCMLCEEAFPNRKKLNAHLRIAHKQNEKCPVRCEECDMTLCNVYKLKQHMFRKHRIIFNCKACKYLTGRKTQLLKHIESAHKTVMSTTCLICKKSYSDRYALKCHMKRLHGDLLGKDGGSNVCRLCEETVPDLKLHMETKHDDKGMKCKICSKQLRLDESLRMHFIQMHSNAGKTVCQYCGDSFANIEAHVATLHMTEKPYKCDTCDYSHATKIGLKNHKLYFHPKGNAHMCHVCPYKSHHKSNLKQHIQVVHEKEKPFQCPQCDKCFFHKGAMMDHVNVIHLRKLFECKHCNKSFTNRSGFNSHQRAVHKGIWHWCDRCNGRFQDKGDLKRHVRNVHDKNYLFRCHRCDRGFPYRTPMREHMLKHHGIKMDDNMLPIGEAPSGNLAIKDPTSTYPSSATSPPVTGNLDDFVSSSASSQAQMQNPLQSQPTKQPSQLKLYLPPRHPLSLPLEPHEMLPHSGGTLH